MPQQYTKTQLALKGKTKRIPISKYKSLDEKYPSSDDNHRLIVRCESYWATLGDFRRRRQRARMYHRGKQWDEITWNPIKNAFTSEGSYIKDQGRIPFKQNIIRTLVKNIIGQYRSNPSKSTVIANDREDAVLSEMMTNGLQKVLDLNRDKELTAKALQEFLLSGSAAIKDGFKYLSKYKRYDGFRTMPNMARMFWNSDISDVRCYDLNLIGEIHDISIDDVVVTFASNEEEAEYLRQIYNIAREKSVVTTTRGQSAYVIDALSFYFNEDAANKCRVIEIWEKRSRMVMEEHDYMAGTLVRTQRTAKEIDAENQSRINQAIAFGIPEEDVRIITYEKVWDDYWYYKFLSPLGHTLKEGESQYEHGEHPYTLLLYPLIDGEVWGVVEDIIDQQRYINRLIGLLDAIMGSSAKGVLLVPEDSIPDGMNLNDFATEWAKFNGVIKIKVKPGAQLPEQISANSSNIGVNELIALQMQLIEQISGVHSAQQGQAPSSGTPSSLYQQQIVQSGLNNLDIFESFNSFKREADSKMLKLLCQYYDSERYVATSGKTYSEDAKFWKPELIQGVDTEVKVISGVDTPAYRMMIDDLLMQLFQNQAIDVEMFLENSSIPFADKMLDKIKQKKQEIMTNPNGQAAAENGMPIQQQQQGLPPEAMEQASQADPRAMELAQRFAGLNNLKN